MNISLRRKFFGSIAGLAAAASQATGQQKPAARYEAARHDKDDWLDIAAKHRVVFDTTTLFAAADAVAFANNYIRANRTDYGVANTELAVVIVVRHNSSPFGYNDAMWAKYGVPFAGRTGNEDPKTKQPPKLNVLNSADYGDLLPNRGLTLDALTKQGVQIAICGMSTRANAAFAARAMGGDADAIYNEIVANLVPNARIVPAGVVTVNRAQERGYSLFKT